MLSHCQRLQRGMFGHMGAAALRTHIEGLERLQGSESSANERARRAALKDSK